MALVKRDGVWHYDFKFKKHHYKGSTFVKNKVAARLIESQRRTDAALEFFGVIGRQKPIVRMLFKDFIANEFLPHVRLENQSKPRTVKFYEEKCRRLLEFPALAESRLTDIDEKTADDYKLWRAAQPRRGHGAGLVSIASINRELSTLRKAVRLAYRWKRIDREPRISVRLKDERGRTFIAGVDLEKEYFARAEYPLKHAAILVCDLGLRPDECVRMLKTDVFFERNYVIIQTGKTENAARALPMTERARKILEFLFALWPDSTWVFPGRRKGRHLTVWALDNLHAKLRRDAIGQSGKPLFPKDFVIYSLRHTFGTRLSASLANNFEIMAAMGHSDVRVSTKYIHPTSEHLTEVMQRKEVLDKMLRGEKTLVVETTAAVPEKSGELNPTKP